MSTPPVTRLDCLGHSLARAGDSEESMVEEVMAGYLVHWVRHIHHIQSTVQSRKTR